MLQVLAGREGVCERVYLKGDGGGGQDSQRRARCREPAPGASTRGSLGAKGVRGR